MSVEDRDIEDGALAWLVRINDPDFDGWDDWEQWLAADPRHGEVYWRLASDEADAVAAIRTAPKPFEAPKPARGSLLLSRRTAMAAALAACVVGVGVLGWSVRPLPDAISTGPGERREVVLADGSRVTLDARTRLTFDRRDPRAVRLESGRALFVVVHDARDPFRVDVGDGTLTDLGTTFDVTRLADGARVGVSEGIVHVRRGRAEATLGPGDGVVMSPSGLERRAVSTTEVQGWRDGRLTYSDETLAVLAEDLSRAFNRPVTVAPQLSGRRFSGSLSTDIAPADQRSRLSALLGVAVVEQGEGWRLEP